MRVGACMSQATVTAAAAYMTMAKAIKNYERTIVRMRCRREPLVLYRLEWGADDGYNGIFCKGRFIGESPASSRYFLTHKMATHICYSAVQARRKAVGHCR